MKAWMILACCAGLVLAGCAGEEAQDVEAIRTATRVACVGDSITEGFGGHSYVEILARDTGAVYGNFGVCGTTATREDAPAYVDSAAYEESLDWKADVVVVMLGTNDTAYWQGRAVFEADLAALCEGYIAQGATLVLATPLAPDCAVLANDYGIRPALFSEVCAAVRAVAQDYALPLAEVYDESVGKDVTLEDGIHPNSEGAALIAEVVARTLEENGLI